MSDSSIQAAATDSGSEGNAVKIFFPFPKKIKCPDCFRPHETRPHRTRQVGQYSYIEGFSRHLTKNHPRMQRMFACSICDHEYKELENVRNHWVEKHSQDYDVRQPYVFTTAGIGAAMDPNRSTAASQLPSQPVPTQRSTSRPVSPTNSFAKVTRGATPLTETNTITGDATTVTTPPTSASSIATTVAPSPDSTTPGTPERTSPSTLNATIPTGDANICPKTTKEVPYEPQQPSSPTSGETAVGHAQDGADTCTNHRFICCTCGVAAGAGASISALATIDEGAHPSSGSSQEEERTLRCQFRHLSLEEENLPTDVAHKHENLVECVYKSVGCNVITSPCKIAIHQKQCNYKDSHRDRDDYAGRAMNKDPRESELVECKYKKFGCMKNIPRSLKLMHQEQCKYREYEQSTESENDPEE